MGQYRKASSGLGLLKENNSGQFMSDHQSAAAVNNSDNNSNAMCSCSQFLNPFPASNGSNPFSSSSTMQHFCRVCNIRLNSCRQARIHTDGKKHTKHLHYLKMCLDDASKQQQQQQQQPTTTANKAVPPQPLPLLSFLHLPTAKDLTSPRYHDPPVSYNGGYPQNGVSSPASAYNGAGPGGMCHPVQFANCPGGTACTAAFLYHPMMPPQQPQPQPQQPPPATAFVQLPQYLPYAPYNPPPLNNNNNNYLQQHDHLLQQALQQQQQQAHMMVGSAQQQQQHENGFQQQRHYHNHHHNQHMMSPSLTSSGFSGSGPDCKSTETGSVLSSASAFSSWSHHNQQQQQQQQPPPLARNQYSHHRSLMSSSFSHKTKDMANNIRSSNVRTIPPLVCRMCHMSFTSQQTLDSHLSAVRHSRKTINIVETAAGTTTTNKKVVGHGHHVVSSMPNLGEASSSSGGGGSNNDIKCEVCQVSVNSSQQLVAHLAGQKHRIKAVRQGLKPNQAMASPSSSTLTSASESENGYPLIVAGGGGGGAGDQISNAPAKLRRRSSEYNLMQRTLPMPPTQQHQFQQHPVNGSSLLRQRCYTTCGGGVAAAPSYSLIRHLSSSCLSRACSRSTTSLRKAVSHTALHKCRSMNLLNNNNTSSLSRRKKRVEEEEGDDEEEEEEEEEDLQSPWSNGRGNEEEGEEEESSGSDQEEPNAASTSEEEYYRNQNFRQEKTPITAAAKSACIKRAAVVAEKAGSANVQCQRYAVESKIKCNPAGKPKKHPPSSSSSGMARKQHANYNNNNNNNSSFMEIPMLNVFLQRLNQHSRRKSGNGGGVVKGGSNNANNNMNPLVVNESDYSNAEN